MLSNLLSAFTRLGCLMQTLIGFVALIGFGAILLLVTSLLGMNLLASLFGSGAPLSTPVPTNTPVITGAPSAGATPTPTAAPTAASTPAPAGEMPAPVNLRSEPVEGEPGSFIIYWDYPVEGEVAPESLDIVINGELYEHSSYEGTNFEYSWFVGDRPCNSSLSVQVVAVAGSLRGESAPLVVETGAC